MTSSQKLTRVLLQTTRIQLVTLIRTWAPRMMDFFMPTLVAFVPILLGRAVAGAEAGSNFAHHAQTPNFAGFLLIGGGSFMLVTRALWSFSVWLKEEMQNGTLESLYLTSGAMPVILAGVALAFMLYSALMYVGAMIVGAIFFQIVFQTNHLAIAIAFLIVGLPPIYGLSLLYGALVLRLKETDGLLQITQLIITILIGAYFPISVFPTALKIISLLFPPTWLTQGLRSALLGIPYFSNSWFIDLTVLAFFCLAGPFLGYLAFSRMEKVLRATSGLSEF
jgi:ABC-2 type transport system permease protein